MNGRILGSDVFSPDTKSYNCCAPARLTSRVNSLQPATAADRAKLRKARGTHVEGAFALVRRVGVRVRHAHLHQAHPVQHRAHTSAVLIPAAVQLRLAEAYSGDCCLWAVLGTYANCCYSASELLCLSPQQGTTGRAKLDKVADNPQVAVSTSAGTATHPTSCSTRPSR